MKIQIVTNIDNRAGLQRDYELLRDLLVSFGHEVHGANVFRDQPEGHFNLNIFIETFYDGRFFGTADRNWFIPNCEWWYDDWEKYLPKIGLVLAKTPHAQQVWQNKIGFDRVVYSAFASQDIYDPGTPKVKSFLHIAGKSEAKNTEAVIEAWKEIPHNLVVLTYGDSREGSELVCDKVAAWAKPVPQVHHIHNCSDEQYRAWMNLCRFAVMPSLYEGYGHALHEAFLCASIVLTTDAPPMNEFLSVDHRLLLPVDHQTPRALVPFSYVSIEGIRHAVSRAMDMQREWDVMGKCARIAALAENHHFTRTMKGLLG